MMNAAQVAIARWVSTQTPESLRDVLWTISRIMSVNTIYWSPAGRGNAETFAEVMSLVERQTQPSIIYVEQQATDPPLVIPANAVPGSRYDMRWSSFVSPIFGDPTANLIQGAAGARLKNLGALAGSLALVGGEDAFLDNDPLNAGSPPIYAADLGAFIGGNGADGTAPIVVPDNGFVVLAIRGGGAQSLNPLASIIRLGANATALLVFQAGVTDMQPTLLAGGATAMAVLQHEGQLRFPVPAQPLFAGTLLNAPTGEVGGAGNTAFRPIGFNGPLAVGCRYLGHADRDAAEHLLGRHAVGRLRQRAHLTERRRRRNHGHTSIPRHSIPGRRRVAAPAIGPSDRCVPPDGRLRASQAPGAEPGADADARVDGLSMGSSVWYMKGWVCR
jgi:hypothetical protein